MIARIAALGLRIVSALAFEVGGRQVVKVEGVVEIEQRPLAGGQRLLDAGALGMQPVEIAIQRVRGERGEVRAQDVAQGRPPDPVRHRIFRGRTHQPVQRHELGEHARPRREPGLGHDGVQCEGAPHLMSDVHGTCFPGVFELHPVGVNRDHVVPRGRAGTGAAARRPHALGERRHGGVRQERRLAAQGGGESLRHSPPGLGGGGRQRAERTDRAMPRPLRGRGGLDEQVVDVFLVADAPGRALDEHAVPISSR